MTDIPCQIFNWVISFRSETLTSFFKILPFFASDSFYIPVIAIGYWRYPRNRLFCDLGFLVPFSALFNCTLKNLFAIPRPDISLHLVPMGKSFGFPSGDVQVAVVFWGMLCLAWQSLGISLWSIGLIATIMVSRLYLGVHSFYDVMGGLLFGIITLLIYRMPLIQSFASPWFSGKTASYWGFVLVCTIAYFGVSPYTPTSVVVSALGVLTGYGLFLQTLPSKRQLPVKGHLFPILLSIGILLPIIFGFPVVKDGSPLLFWGTGLIKYALLAFLVFFLLPQFQRWVSKV